MPYRTLATPTATIHAISIHHEPPSRDGALVLQGGHRASCSCGWGSDCYAHSSDTQRAINVHQRQVQRNYASRFDTQRARSQKLSAEDKAFMRGFGAALASIWRCHHDGQMVQHLIKANNFELTAFHGVGMLPTDLAAIRQAVQR